MQAVWPGLDRDSVPLDLAANRSGTLTALSAANVPQRIGAGLSGTLASGSDAIDPSIPPTSQNGVKADLCVSLSACRIDSSAREPSPSGGI